MRDHTGPPFPNPTIDLIRTMPQSTEAELDAKRAAARTWLREFCARARFHLEVTDLRVAARQQQKCAREIDKARPLLSEAEIDAALIGPG